jgi:hypothetical protein
MLFYRGRLFVEGLDFFHARLISIDRGASTKNIQIYTIQAVIKGGVLC